MSYKEAKILRDANDNPIPQYYDPAKNEFKALLGKDGLLPHGSKEEYYFDCGALLRLGSTQKFNIGAGDELQFEIEHGNSNVKIMSYLVSTLADEYSIKIYELPTRIVENEEAEADYTKLNLFQLNRLNKEVFPLNIYKLEENAEHILTDDNLIYSSIYIMEEAGGGVFASDMGGIGERVSMAYLDTVNYNYVVAIENDNNEARDFAMAILFGVPDLLPDI